jgi:phosphatidylserine decarboxylase
MFSSLGILIYYHFLRIYGKITVLFAHFYIPRILRKFILGWYIKGTNSRLHESVKSLEEFPTIHDFFVREIKPRSIDIQELVSPADCTILQAGNLIKNDWKVNQIKNINYSIEDILGLYPDEMENFKRLEDLHFISIHLPVSESHRFRSPVDWHIKLRTHIPGSMFGLHQKNLFNCPFVFYNERVILEGDWQHGKFWFIAFGSNKVGSIHLKFDEDLRTNVIGETFRKEEKDEEFKPLQYNGLNTTARVKKLNVKLSKAEELGNFEGGSAFLIIFQKRNTEFVVHQSQFVTYGTALIE